MYGFLVDNSLVLKEPWQIVLVSIYGITVGISIIGNAQLYCKAVLPCLLIYGSIHEQYWQQLGLEITNIKQLPQYLEFWNHIV